MGLKFEHKFTGKIFLNSTRWNSFKFSFKLLLNTVVLHVITSRVASQTTKIYYHFSHSNESSKFWQRLRRNRARKRKETREATYVGEVILGNLLDESLHGFLTVYAHKIQPHRLHNP
jgi:hypothetical protein